MGCGGGGSGGCRIWGKSRGKKRIFVPFSLMMRITMKVMIFFFFFCFEN